MKIPPLRFYVLPAAALLATAIGCTAGNESQLAPTTAVPLRARLSLFRGEVPVHPSLRVSWMKPSAKASKLLYDSYANEVNVYSYPSGIQVGAIGGFAFAQGDCVDRAGDVWIVDTDNWQLVEFKHAALRPKAILTDSGELPDACVVNPKTGDLVVANAQTTAGGAGSISIYRKATGQPKVIPLPPAFKDDTVSIYYLGYDDKENLFFDGCQWEGSECIFVFFELPSGSSTVKLFPLSGANPSIPGGIEYADGVLNVADQGNPILMHVNAAGKVIGQTIMQWSGTGGQPVMLVCGPIFFINKNKNKSRFICSGYIDLVPAMGVFKYPAGGAPTAPYLNRMIDEVGFFVISQ